MILTDVHLWALLGVLLPPIVGLVTKAETKSGIQGALMTGLAAVLGVIVEGVQAEQAGTGFAWKVALGTALVAWIIGQVSHAAVWSPTGIAKFLQKLGFSQSEQEAVIADLRKTLDDLIAAGHVETVSPVTLGAAATTGQPIAPADLPPKVTDQPEASA